MTEGRAPGRGRTTIYDVARAAGVSPSTVSRAFSRPGRVTAATAAHVRSVADELGYHTDAVAGTLAIGRTSMLAMVVSDLTNPFYVPIVRAAQAEAEASGYTLLVVDFQESAATERKALERMLPVVEGVVLGTSRMPDSVVRMMVRQRPTVVLNRAVVGVPSVVTDSAGGMSRAVGRLAELGHRTIAYAAGPEGSWADGVRWQALRESARALKLRARRIGPLAPTLVGGEVAARAVRESGVTAVVAYNDLVAIGLMRRLQHQGVVIPEQISIVGFDDIVGADLCSPALSTVAAPLAALGQRAVRTVLGGSRRGAPGSARVARLPTVFIERQSSGQALAS